MLCCFFNMFLCNKMDLFRNDFVKEAVMKKIPQEILINIEMLLKNV